MSVSIETIVIPDPGPGEEFFIASPHGGERGHFLELLIQQGWSPAGETDAWDLEKSGSRLLMATEQGEGTAKRILIRTWGLPQSAVPTLAILGDDA